MESVAAWGQTDTSNDAPDEATLVEAARSDPAAFGRLYHCYLDRVYRYLRVRSPTAEDAADLTQQVFLQAFKGLAAYRGERVPFAAWLFRIAHHLAIDAARRRRETVPWDGLPEALHPAAAADLEADILRQEAVAHLRTCLARIAPEKRELLALRFAARLSAREIAAVVGKSEAAVQKQIARTIQNLKDQYDA